MDLDAELVTLGMLDGHAGEVFPVAKADFDAAGGVAAKESIEVQYSPGAGELHPKFRP